MRAIIYLRVSSDDQVSGTSLDTQEQACRRIAEARQYEILAVYREEGVSAKTARRPQLIAAMEAARTAKADALIVYKVDRFARNQTDFHALRSRLEAHGCMLVSASEDLTDDPAGRLLSGMLAAVAQFDNDVRAERSRSGMRARKAAGGWVAAVPTGYRRVRLPDGTPSLEVIEDQAVIVRQMYEAYVSGVSASEAAKRAIAAGLVNAAGNASHNSLVRILHHQVYAGLHTDGTPGRWPSIVSKQIWQAAQERARGRQPVAVDDPNAILKGVVRCSRCRSFLLFAYVKGRYPYYWCRHCREIKTVRAERLIEHVETCLRECTVTVDQWRALSLQVVAAWERAQRPLRQREAAQRAQIDALHQQQERLLTAYTKGMIDEEDFARARGKLLRQITSHAATAERNEVKADQLMAVLDKALQLVCDPVGFLHQCTPYVRTLFWQFYCSTGLLWDGQEVLNEAKPILFEMLSTAPKAICRKACPDEIELNILMLGKLLDAHAG